MVRRMPQVMPAGRSALPPSFQLLRATSMLKFDFGTPPFVQLTFGRAYYLVHARDPTYRVNG